MKSIGCLRLPLVALTLTLSISTAQTIYLLPCESQSPFPCEISLYKIEPETQTVQKVRQLFTAKESHDGIFVSHEHRMIAVFGPRFKSRTIQLIDMDHPAATILHSLEFGDLRLANWLDWTNENIPKDYAQMKAQPSEADISSHPAPEDGHFVESEQGKFSLLRRFVATRGVLNVLIPVDSIYPAWQPKISFGTQSSIGDALISGEYGVPFKFSDAQFVKVASGMLIQDVGGKVVKSGVPVPPTASSSEFFHILAKSKNTAVVSAFEDPKANQQGEGHSILHLYNFSTSKWTEIKIPGGVPKVKLIDKWLVGVAASDATTKTGKHERTVRGVTSPGAQERANLRNRTIRVEHGAFDSQALYYFPGILYLIDTENMKRYHIRTNQGDSEILLVQDNTVYYRVNEDLFRAQIEDKGLGEAVKIASDPVIRESHWAFISRQY